MKRSAQFDIGPSELRTRDSSTMDTRARPPLQSPPDGRSFTGVRAGFVRSAMLRALTGVDVELVAARLTSFEVAGFPPYVRALSRTPSRWTPGSLANFDRENVAALLTRSGDTRLPTRGTAEQDLGGAIPPLDLGSATLKGCVAGATAIGGHRFCHGEIIDGGTLQ